jgi:hypothetical protein
MQLITRDAYVAMKAEQYKDDPNTTRKPKRFNAFSANFTPPVAKSTKNSYASKDDEAEGKLLKFTTEKEDASLDDIKVNILAMGFLNDIKLANTHSLPV